MLRIPNCKRRTGESYDTCRTASKARVIVLDDNGKPIKAEGKQLHATPHEKGAAVDMYFDGLSYRRVARNMEQYFGRETNPPRPRPSPGHPDRTGHPRRQPRSPRLANAHPRHLCLTYALSPSPIPFPHPVPHVIPSVAGESRPRISNSPSPCQHPNLHKKTATPGIAGNDGLDCGPPRMKSAVSRRRQWRDGRRSFRRWRCIGGVGKLGI